MVEIARTGISRQTLYNHYPDVDRIVADAATRHNEQAIAGLRQHLAVADSPTETIGQLVRYIAAISTHGHTLTPITGSHRTPRPTRRLRPRTRTTDRDTLDEGRAAGQFRSSLDPDTTTRLVRHMLNGVSDLVAETPDIAAHIANEAARTILAAITSTPPG